MYIRFKKTFQDGRKQEYAYLTQGYREGKLVRHVSIYLGNKKKLKDKYGDKIGGALLKQTIPKRIAHLYLDILKEKIALKRSISV